MIFITQLLLFSMHCFAGEAPPEWVINHPSPSATEFYYVGSSEGASSYGSAIEIASKSAMEKAIRDNYGVDAQIENKFYETTTESSLTSTLSEKSKRVRIEGFRVEKTYARQLESGLWNTFILYSYNKAEIEKEKKRLSSLSVIENDIKFAEIGNVSNQSATILEIVTKPLGATIMIDGKDAITKSPIRLNGILEIGKHSLVIDHPEFKPISREIIIQPGDIFKIDEVLIPAEAYLSVESNPSGAAIILNGMSVGTTPLSNIKVLTNRKYKIDFIHPDAFQQSTDIVLSRDEHKTVNQNLNLIPAKLQIISNPPNAEIYLDGNLLNKGWNSIEPGEHQFSAKLKNYEDYTSKINLHGGEKRIEKISLVALSIKEMQKQEDAERLKHSPYILTFGMSVLDSGTHVGDIATDSAGIIFGFEKKFYNLFGLKVSSAGSVFEGTTEQPTNTKMVGNITFVSLPIYFSEIFYVAPVAGRSVRTYGPKQYSSIQFAPWSVHQDFNGGIFGLYGFSENWGGAFEVGLLNFGDYGNYKGSSTSICNLNLIYRY